jgi:hypothetical protein
MSERRRQFAAGHTSPREVGVVHQRQNRMIERRGADLDLAAFGEKGRRGRGFEAWGPVRLNRSPRRQCRITVEQAYPAALATSSCSNPTFFHQPSGAPEERIKLTTNIPPEPQPQD